MALCEKLTYKILRNAQSVLKRPEIILANCLASSTHNAHSGLLQAGPLPGPPSHQRLRHTTAQHRTHLHPPNLLNRRPARSSVVPHRVCRSPRWPPQSDPGNATRQVTPSSACASSQTTPRRRIGFKCTVHTPHARVHCILCSHSCGEQSASPTAARDLDPRETSLPRPEHPRLGQGAPSH
jgi:hypothetical protein